MTCSSRQRKVRPTDRPLSDAGITLIEVLVATGVMSIVMSVATACLIVLLRTDRSVAAMTEAQAQLGRTFHLLDREVRYAADLRTYQLAASSPHPSLMWLSTGDGAKCSAVSLINDRLQLQQWLPGAGVGPATVLASGVYAIRGVPPFAVAGGGGLSSAGADPAVPASPKEATIAITAAAGGSVQLNQREFRETIVARNSIRGPHGTSLNECVP
jgi:type II secretory pathway pseudopilin PulG